MGLAVLELHMQASCGIHLTSLNVYSRSSSSFVDLVFSLHVINVIWLSTE